MEEKMAITHDIWMKETYSRFHPRSEAFKAIDAALLKKDKLGAKLALINWIDGQNKKKKDWHKSVRNEKQTVETLYKELGILGFEIENQSFKNLLADSYAKNEVRKMQFEAKSKMFNGKRLQVKDSFFGITQTQSKSKLAQIAAFASSNKNVAVKEAKAIKTVGGIANNIKTAIESITEGINDEETKSEIVMAVFGAEAAEFAAEMAPLFGILSSGAKATKDWVNVAIKINQKSTMTDHYVDMRAGDPSRALEAIIRIIDSEISKTKTDGKIHTSAFAAKSLGVLIDGGTGTSAAVGACEKVALLINTLVDVVREYKQMEAGNKIIKEQKFDLEMFNTCPILGCYFIVMQDHSTIMDFDFANMGKENWQQEALRLKYAINPVIKQADKYIQSARIEINGFKNAKGVYHSTLMQMIRLKYKSRGWGQSQAPQNGNIISLPYIDFVEEVVKGDL
jgi:hypothetical protein